jgi:CBS domain-containing protein
MIHPSPAIITRADTPISDCVKLMKEHDVGSLLIIKNDIEGELIGIFTERDLVKKIIEIQYGNHWHQSVSTVMTSPVLTLDISEFDQAAAMMLKQGIRHIPVTVSDSFNKKRLVGVISMRDLFRNYVVQKETLQDRENVSKPTKKIPFTFALVTENDFFARFITEVFLAFIAKDIKRISFKEINSNNQCDAYILDLDSFLDNSQISENTKKDEKYQWSKQIKDVNKNSEIKLVIIVLDPSKHSSALTGVLEKLEKSKKFLVFKKPIEVSQLVFKLQTFEQDG